MAGKISLHIIAILSLAHVHVANLEEACSRDESSFADCSKGENLAQETRMTRSMELLAGDHAERVTVDGSEGIFVSIKTTQKYHGTRLPPLVLTWLQTLRPEQVGVVIPN